MDDALTLLSDSALRSWLADALADVAPLTPQQAAALQTELDARLGDALRIELVEPTQLPGEWELPEYPAPTLPDSDYEWALSEILGMELMGELTCEVRP